MAPPSPPSPRRPLPHPVETTTKNTRRRFVPEPVETTAKSSRAPAIKEPLAEAGSTSPKPRRFLPQPVETSIKSSKKEKAVGDGLRHDFTGMTSSAQRTHPQPIESKPKPRKFSPQLIETVKRSRKSSDTLPAVLHSDKTEASPGDPDHPHRQLRPRPGALPIPPKNSPVVSSDNIPRVPESRFTSSKLSEKAARRHSFRVPDLPSIQSVAEESEESSCPSLSTSPSGNSDQTVLYKHANRVGEIGDDKTSGYLLSLAAQAADKQLREQVMAAYPNEHDHEQVDHFAFDRDSDESDDAEGEGRLSRAAPRHVDGADQGSKHSMGHADGWSMAEMRRHQEKLKKERKDRNVTKQPELARQLSVKATIQNGNKTKDVQHATDATGAPKSIIGGWQKGVGMAPMRNAASPPMAGENLKFPKCLSPRQTRLDVTQHHHRPNSSGSATPEEHSGLWTPNGGASRKNSTSGLWMGVCAASMQNAQGPPKLAQTGLLTPSVERDDPFSGKPPPSNQQLPPSPPTSLENETLCLDRILTREEELDKKFNDAFVTQIYNYLSLGYPSMARKYDSELCKITKVPLVELRQDDEHTNAKGYVGAPEGNGVEVSGVQDGQCGRWLALRLYVREWARQQPDMVEREGGANNDWGARARKGSWAI